MTKFRFSNSEIAKQIQDLSGQAWNNLYHLSFKDVQDHHEESFPWVKKTAILMTKHDKKHCNGSSKSLVCLNSQQST